MVYVPTPPRPSRRATELSHRINEVVRDYAARNQGLTQAEIREALKLARVHSPGAPSSTGLVAGLLTVLAGLGVFVYAASGSGELTADRPVLLWAIAAGVIALLVAFVAGRVGQ